MKRNYDTINLLRGVAALAVIIGHFNEFFRPFVSGLFAVDIFFVMSGFVIANAYEKRLASTMAFWGFARVRMIRLYPLYFLGTALGLAAALISTQPLPHRPAGFDLAAIPLSFFLLPVINGKILFPFDPVAWSLFLEIAVNALYAVTWRLWTIRNLLLWLPASAAVLFVTGVVDGFDVGWSWETLLGGVARVVFGFPFGVLIYRIKTQTRASISMPWIIPLLLGAVCIAPVSSLLFKTLMVFVAVPATVMAAVMVEPPQGLQRLAQFMGDISYALYALHLPLVWVLLIWLRLEPTALTGLFLALAVMLIAWIIHRYFDEPIRRLLTRVMVAPPGTVRRSRPC